MNEDAEEQEPFPELDAAGALRAAFRTRASSSGLAPSASAAAPVAIHAERQGYELRGEIARGGMGVILEAFDRALTREVALKVLRDELAHEPRCVQRFLEEARVTARLDHPGIVPVHEAGRDPAGRAFFAMRLVRGRDLRRIMELANADAEGWSLTRALSVFLKVCEAMAYAHERGVLHRDLKPSNVMVGEFGEVYVMDWGLARVLGHGDAHDLRLRAPAGAVDLASVESPIVTMDGEVLGTPCYMSPEQAQGRMVELGPHSDVYSVGAMLYHLLSGEMPYVPAGASVASRTVLLHLVQGPPRPLHELRRDLPGELIAISERAMARAPRDRYSGMSDMAEDLRAFLERRVVRAYETGAWAEARKWVQRNKGFAAACAAAVLALVCGLVASLVLRAESERNAAAAQRNEDQAELEQERAEANEQLATRRADDVLRLSALQDLDDLVAEAAELWPAQPEMVPRYEGWLARAQRKLEELPAHETKLAELRAKAVPWSAQQAAEVRAKHPRSAELAATRRQLDHRRRLRVALDSAETQADADPVQAGVDFAVLPATARELDDLARPLVDPERGDWGGEVRGLLLARRAVELAASLAPPERASIRVTLAWALFANGRLDDALAEAEEALSEAGAARVAEFQTYLDELQESIEARISPLGLEEDERRVAELETRLAELEAEVAQRPEWNFEDTQDKWWHNQLAKLVDGLRAFSDSERGLLSSGISPEHGWGVKKRLEFARTIEERSLGGREASARWSLALASIRNQTECPQYAGLVLAPQLGLLPIGPDPDSGLWEFAHLQTGEPPQRGPDGKLILREDSGLVLVLIPASTFWMGAQGNDPGGRNYEAGASDDERPVHEVSLTPYFLSKYEMTQGQWSQLTAGSPSVYGPTRHSTSWNASHLPWSALHPVEQVSWTECSETLARASLALPTEAQWECACRAGTGSAFWSGDEPESLRDVANLSDSYAKSHGSENLTVLESWLDDGETVHGRVGSYRANAYGLHDVHGNVWEWCRDWHGDYGKPARAGDGERRGTGSTSRVYRGGSFGTAAVHARSAFRFMAAPDYANDNLGVRPARPITP